MVEDLNQAATLFNGVGYLIATVTGLLAVRCSMDSKRTFVAIWISFISCLIFSITYCDYATSRSLVINMKDDRLIFMAHVLSWVSFSSIHMSLVRFLRNEKNLHI